VSASGRAPEPREIALPAGWHDDLLERLENARWPEPVAGEWELGIDLGYLRELCRYWADSYDPGRLAARLNEHQNLTWEGLHFIHARAGGDALPLLLIHGWPGGPIEFLAAIPPLLEAGHDLVIPSLPGFGFSEIPAAPLNIAAVAERLRELMESGLGYVRYAVQGGDWGSPISARIAHDARDNVAALHINAPSVLPLPVDVADPPLSEAEQEYIQNARRWRLRRGYHLLLQSNAPDAVSPAFNDSPTGLAGWLVEKYMRWSDCDGDVERRFSKDDLCDFVTMYWATGTIGSSMRLYWGEARNRWRLEPGERVATPSAVADFPAEIVRPPRQWTQRVLGDLRHWTEMPSGGHFAAFEEPELFTGDVNEFLDEIG
jgi:pimeloyl-ACP methyl ester carboxylesterase